jgi:hypothetical protein
MTVTRLPQVVAAVMLIAMTFAGCARGPDGPGRDAAASPPRGTSDDARDDATSDGDLATESPSTTGPRIRLRPTDEPVRTNVIEVAGIDPALCEVLADSQLTTDEWAQVFRVFVAPSGSSQSTNDVPSVLGSIRFADSRLQFEPRYPLEPGVRYRAVFDLRRAPDSIRARIDSLKTGDASIGDATAISADLVVPPVTVAATTQVTHVYPTRDRLPENQLKFYIHFSAPMSRGGSYQYVHLLDGSGDEVHLPFLELDEELWDPTGTRFTLLFDPGRIKRGLKPREEVGPTLVEGQSYTLVIDRDWRDAAGNPLVESVRKSFDVGPPDDKQPDPNTWTFTAPMGRTAGPLVVNFPEPLDHAMLQRGLAVTDPSDRPVPGQVSVERGEMRWRFTPSRAWLPGRFTLVIDTSLEDLAGNSIARPFEVDVTRKIEGAARADTFTISFEIKSPARPN